MARLVCIDVDGTLVGTGGRVAPRVWPAAERALAAGIPLALCTGRPGFGIARALAERLGRDAWHVFQNGASLQHLASGQTRSAALPPAAVEALLQEAARTGAVLELYAETEYAVESTSELARHHAALLGVPFLPRPLTSLAGPIVRAQWIVPHEQVAAFTALTPAALDVTPATAPDMPEVSFLNLTSAGVGKASAVRILADLHGIGLDEVMFVGDSGNDVEAMRIVGWPVAMGNASQQVHAVARLRVSSANDGGVADALEEALAQAASR